MKNSKKEYVTIDTTDFEIVYTHKISDTVIGFSLKGKGCWYSGLKVVKYKDNYFIGFPSQKGKDGNYYDCYKLYFSKEDEEEIIREVMKRVDNG